MALAALIVSTITLGLVVLVISILAKTLGWDSPITSQLGLLVIRTRELEYRAGRSEKIRQAAGIILTHLEQPRSSGAATVPGVLESAAQSLLLLHLARLLKDLSNPENTLAPLTEQQDEVMKILQKIIDEELLPTGQKVWIEAIGLLETPKS